MNSGDADAQPARSGSLPRPSEAAPAIFTFPNRILFGAGAVASLPAELGRLGVHRPLIVTDAGLVALGMVDRAIAAIAAPGRGP